MDVSFHRRLEELFQACADLADEERERYLDRHCAGDRGLRAQVEDLLRRSGGGGVTPQPLTRLLELDDEPVTIGRYRVVGRLGEGGFGQVFRAEQDEPVRRQVAVKILKAGLDTRAVLARFDAERQALELMDHPGIAKVFDAGQTEGGRPYFVMELVSGEPVTQYVERRALSARERLALVVMTCRAIEHAHQKGIIHRDLKPSNILVIESDGQPAPKVIDFGIAKAAAGALAGGTLQTTASELLGTPEFMSPEQALSGGRDVDTRTDVYSLGVVLYRLLTGRLPFDVGRLRAGGVLEMARIIQFEEPLPPSRAAGTPALRGDLDWIVSKALAKDRGQRYPSAAALADDIERHLRDEPVMASPPSRTYRARKFLRRHRAPVLGVSAALAVLLAGVVTTGWQAVRARRAEAVARIEAETALRVNDFVRRMLHAGNPDHNPKARAITVREVIDRAAAELDATAFDRPEFEAGIRTTLGMTYSGLGLYEEAERELRRATALHAVAPDARGNHVPAAVLEAEIELARVETLRSRYAEAEERLERIAPMVDALPGDLALRSRFLAARGGNLANLSRYAESDSLLTLSVRLLRQDEAARGSRRTAPLEEVRMDLGRALLELGDVRRRIGRLDEAEALGREALGRIRAAHAVPHHDISSASGRLALTLKTKGNLAGAESLFAGALAIDREILGPEHPWVAMHLGNLAAVWDEQGRHEEAERGLRECLSLLTLTFGPDHAEVTSAMGSLATALQRRGAFEEALRLRREALAIERRLLGETHSQIAVALNNIGSTCRLMKRYDEAEAAFREAIGICGQVYPSEHPTTIAARHNLGKTLLDAGRAREAEAPLTAALESGRRALPAGHPHLGVIEATYGRMLSELGRYAQAERALLAAQDAITRNFGTEHERTKEAAAYLAALYDRWHRPTDATRPAAPAPERR